MFVSPKTDFGVKELMANPIVRNQPVSDTLRIPLEQIRGLRLRNPFFAKVAPQAEAELQRLREELKQYKGAGIS